jgi:hypothetical protein
MPPSATQLSTTKRPCRSSPGCGRRASALASAPWNAAYHATNWQPGCCAGALDAPRAHKGALSFFSNPLLSSRVYNEQTFSKRGLDMIAETDNLQGLVNRHFPAPVTASLSLPPRSSVFRLRRPSPEEPNAPEARAAE